jgi:hypothetical protein
LKSSRARSTKKGLKRKHGKLRWSTPLQATGYVRAITPRKKSMKKPQNAVVLYEKQLDF